MEKLFFKGYFIKCIVYTLRSILFNITKHNTTKPVRCEATGNHTYLKSNEIIFFLFKVLLLEFECCRHLIFSVSLIEIYISYLFNLYYIGSNLFLCLFVSFWIFKKNYCFNNFYRNV